MTFDQPLALVGMLAVIPAITLVLWTVRRRHKDLGRLAQPQLVAGMLAGPPDAGRQWRLALWLVAFLFLVVAVARPQCGEKELFIEQEGVQIMVALDVSASMLAAEDVRPDRLARAKLELIDLMDRLDGDEVGLVLFSGAAFVQLPRTSDYLTARRFLDEADVDSISRPGTAVGLAIETAAGALDLEREGAKVILLMTDGEDSETDPLAAAREAADQGITILAVGFGSPQGHEVPDLDAYGNVVGVKTDDSGRQILSRLDEMTLRAVADASGGRYIEPEGAAVEVAAAIDSLQAAQLEGRLQTQPVERFQIFLAVAVLALAASELIPHSLRRRAPHGVEG